MKSTIRWILVLPLGLIASAITAGMNMVLYMFLPETVVDFWNAFSTAATFSYMGLLVAPTHKIRTGITMIGLVFLCALLVVIAGHLGTVSAPQWKLYVWTALGVFGAGGGCILAGDVFLETNEKAEEQSKH